MTEHTQNTTEMNCGSAGSRTSSV